VVSSSSTESHRASGISHAHGEDVADQVGVDKVLKRSRGLNLAQSLVSKSLRFS
jgi:hypothetical protein